MPSFFIDLFIVFIFVVLGIKASATEVILDPKAEGLSCQVVLS